jgi:hypothetical protein
VDDEGEQGRAEWRRHCWIDRVSGGMNQVNRRLEEVVDRMMTMRRITKTTTTLSILVITGLIKREETHGAYPPVNIHESGSGSGSGSTLARSIDVTSPQVRWGVVEAHNRWSFAKDLPFVCADGIAQLSTFKLGGDQIYCTTDTKCHQLDDPVASRLWVRDLDNGNILTMRPLQNGDLGTSDRWYEMMKGEDDDWIALARKVEIEAIEVSCNNGASC